MKGKNSIISFIALLIILYFIGLPILGIILSNKFGNTNDVIMVLADLFPFGEGIAQIAIRLMNSMMDQAISYQVTQGYLTLSYVLGELSKAVFVMLVFEMLNFLGEGLLKLNDGGKWNKAKKNGVNRI